MADEADRAQVHVDGFLAASLAAATRRPGPAPVIIMGETCCHDCWEPIPQARLDALPGVGLCVECQEEREGSA